VLRKQPDCLVRCSGWAIESVRCSSSAGQLASAGCQRLIAASYQPESTPPIPSPPDRARIRCCSKCSAATPASIAALLLSTSRTHRNKVARRVQSNNHLPRAHCAVQLWSLTALSGQPFPLHKETRLARASRVPASDNANSVLSQFVPNY
jgi:hypothetical protein